MHKVVVERPRWNPGPGKGGRRANLPDELLPKFEGIKRPHAHRKGLTDLLGPLRRWLHAQLGRPWNDVYSEACAVIKADSVVRAHVKTHLLEFVHRNTFMKGNQVWCFTGRWRMQEVPVSMAADRWSSFYVDPIRKILCETPFIQPRRWHDPHAAHRMLTGRWLDERTLIRRLHGLWFECRVEVFPRCMMKGDSPWRFDVAEKKLICRGNAHDSYGRDVYCIAKRQLSRCELRRFGVCNVNQADNRPERSLRQVIKWLVDDCVPVSVAELAWVVLRK